jgi:protein gp37
VSDKSAIEWTDATWNPVTGCTKVSPGCDHCYAETLSERFRGTAGHYFENGFDVQLRPDKLDQPLRWKKPRRIFVNSMSDLFHDDIPYDYLVEVWATMAVATQHTFQVLTKRHGRMRSLLNSQQFNADWWSAAVDLIGSKASMLWGGQAEVPQALPNVWLGVSVENQQWADIRWPALRDTPAAVRFLSMEPLLGPVELDENWLHGDPECRCDDPAGCHTIDWVIVGGESGRGARPMYAAWARSLRDECAAAGVPFLFKQWGEWGPTAPIDNPLAEQIEPGMQRVGKKAAGHELDGRTWDQYPADAS